MRHLLNTWLHPEVLFRFFNTKGSKEEKLWMGAFGGTALISPMLLMVLH
jgi:hypothetical protein